MAESTNNKNVVGKYNFGGGGQKHPSAELQVFQNDQFGQVRTVQKGGETWFVAKDIAESLGYVWNGTQRIAHVPEQWRGVTSVVTSFGDKEMAILSEQGLYFFLGRSDKEKALPFQMWVANDVMPSIRKHGAYMTPEVLEQALLNPDVLIKLATALKEEREKRKVLETQNAIMLPKAEYFDELVDRHLLTNFRDTAKELKIAQTELIDFLLDGGYIYRNRNGRLMPYAHTNNDLFEVKECYNSKTDWAGVQTLITPKGRETFRLLMQRGGEAQ